MPSFYTGRYKCGSCGYFTNNFYLYDFPQDHPLKNHYWKGPYHACEECASMHPLVRQAEKLGEAHAWGPHSIHSRADWLDLNFLPTPQEWKEEDEKRVRVRAYLDSLAAPALGEAIDEKKARAPVLRLEASQPSPATQERTPQPSQTEIPSAVPIVYDTSEEAYKAMRIEDNRRLRATYNPDLPAEFPEEVIEVEALALQRLHAKAEAWITRLDQMAQELLASIEISDLPAKDRATLIPRLLSHLQWFLAFRAKTPDILPAVVDASKESGAFDAGEFPYSSEE